MREVNEWSSDNQSTSSNSATQHSFPELMSKINNSMQELGGNIFLKLNYSSPKDAN